MWFLGLQSGDTFRFAPSWVAIAIIDNAQNLHLLNRLLSRSLKNAWVSCQMHDNDSITGLFIINVIPWASIWGQLPICPILGCNCNYWQAQKLQFPNRFLSRSLRNTWVSCQKEDNDSTTGLFIMNEIPWASNWGQLPISPILSAIAIIDSI